MPPIALENATNTTALREAVKALENVGFFTYLLPLALIFSIIYAVMESAKILKEEMRALIAFLSALFIWYFANLPTLVTSFGMMFAGASMILVVILSVLLVIGLMLPVFGLTHEDIGEWASNHSYLIIGLVILSFVLVFFAFYQTPGWKLIFGTTEIRGIENIEGYLVIGIVLLSVLGAVLWIIKEE